MAISGISMALGIASVGYFVFYAACAGINQSFLYVWLIFGLLCIGYAFLHQYIRKSSFVWLKRVECAGLVLFLCSVVLLFCGIGRIAAEGQKEPSKNADYVVILGAHVFGERMSANLRYRVEAAYEYLKENPRTKAVLSGGQGNGEDITEAEAMRRYLSEKGIAEDRLLCDDTSVNTEQNIQNSIELMGSKDKKMILVSNDFHIYRAKKIAQKQGCSSVEGIGAKTHPYTVLNSYVREAIAVAKYKLCGQI